MFSMQSFVTCKSKLHFVLESAIEEAIHIYRSIHNNRALAIYTLRFNVFPRENPDSSTLNALRPA